MPEDDTQKLQHHASQCFTDALDDICTHNEIQDLDDARIFVQALKSQWCINDAIALRMWSDLLEARKLEDFKNRNTKDFPPALRNTHRTFVQMLELFDGSGVRPTTLFNVMCRLQDDEVSFNDQ